MLFVLLFLMCCVNINGSQPYSVATTSAAAAATTSIAVSRDEKTAVVPCQLTQKLMDAAHKTQKLSAKNNGGESHEGLTIEQLRKKILEYDNLIVAYEFSAKCAQSDECRSYSKEWFDHCGKKVQEIKRLQGDLEKQVPRIFKIQSLKPFIISRLKGALKSARHKVAIKRAKKASLNSLIAQLDSLAALQVNEEMIKTLIETAIIQQRTMPGGLEARDSQGHTPLTTAVYFGHLIVGRELRKAGAKLSDKDKINPFSVARMQQQFYRRKAQSAHEMKDEAEKVRCENDVKRFETIWNFLIKSEEKINRRKRIRPKH